MKHSIKGDVRHIIITFLFLVLSIAVYAEDDSETREIKKPEIKGKTALTIDVETNEIIYAKDIDRRMYPASTTKLVTAILLAKNKERDDILSYSTLAKSSYPFKLDLPAGTGVKAENAMDALLLFSANDIAWMIGENIDNTIEQFSFRMNEFVKQLYLKNTHFINPSGLHDTDHYSTAYDLSVIARDLYSYQWLMETMRKTESTFTINDRIIVAKNRNKLITKDGCIGGKTGWTPEAGRCLVALFERDKRRIAGVVLGSEYNYKDTIVFEDMLTIIDYSYKIKKVEIFKANSRVKTIRFSFKIFPFIGPIVTRSLDLEIRDSVSVYPGGEEVRISFSPSPVNIFYLEKSKPQGNLVIRQREKTLYYPLYPAISTSDILRWDILPFYTTIVALLLIVTLVVLFFKLVIGKR